MRAHNRADKLHNAAKPQIAEVTKAVRKWTSAAPAINYRHPLLKHLIKGKIDGPRPSSLTSLCGFSIGASPSS